MSDFLITDTQRAMDQANHRDHRIFMITEHRGAEEATRGARSDQHGLVGSRRGLVAGLAVGSQAWQSDSGPGGRVGGPGGRLGWGLAVACRGLAARFRAW